MMFSKESLEIEKGGARWSLGTQDKGGRHSMVRHMEFYVLHISESSGARRMGPCVNYRI